MAPTTACPPASSSVISYAPGAGRTVALTFDDGPGPYTASILDVLRQKGAKATFYDTGAHARTWGALEKHAVAEGNVIGNHTYSHRHLTTLPLAGQSNEMDLASNAIRTAAGVSTCTFRPPYGSYNSSTLAAAYARRMSVVTWSVDTEDWKQSAQLSPYWTNRIITRAEAGARLTHPLILFHAGKASPEPESKVASERPNTVAALPLVIDFYKSHGYTFVVLGR